MKNKSSTSFFVLTFSLLLVMVCIIIKIKDINNQSNYQPENSNIIQGVIIEKSDISRLQYEITESSDMDTMTPKLIRIISFLVLDEDGNNYYRVNVSKEKFDIHVLGDFVYIDTSYYDNNIKNEKFARYIDEEDVKSLIEEEKDN